MNTSHLSAGISLLAAVAALGTAWWQHDAEQAALRAAALEQAHTQVVTGQLADLRSRFDATSRKLAESEQRVAAERVRVPAPAVVTPRRSAVADPEAAGREFMAAHPEMPAVLEGINARGFDSNYGDALRAIGVTPSERSRFARELIRAADGRFHIKDSGGSWGGREDTVDAMRSFERSNERLWELLGDARQADFLEAYALKMLHQLGKSTATASYEAGEPLVAGQVQALNDAIQRHGALRRSIAVGWFRPGSVLVDPGLVDWKAVKADLTGSWSAAQLQAIDVARGSDDAAARLRSTMKRNPISTRPSVPSAAGK